MASAPVAATASAPPVAVVAPAAAAQAMPAQESTVAQQSSLPHALPSVRKVARELGVPLAVQARRVASGGIKAMLQPNISLYSRQFQAA